MIPLFCEIYEMSFCVHKVGIPLESQTRSEVHVHEYRKLIENVSMYFMCFYIHWTHCPAKALVQKKQVGSTAFMEC